MKVELNVDETQIKELIDGHLSDLPEDMIKNILVECIRGYFSQNNYAQIENLFIETKEKFGYHKEKSASLFLQRLIKDCDYSKLQDVVDASINNLIEHNDTLLKDIIIDAITEKLRNTYSFQDAVRDALIRLKYN